MKTWDKVRLGWSDAAEAILDRLVAMLHVKAVFYVLAFVLGVGSIGVWVAVVMNAYEAAAPRDVYLSLLTFGVAVSVSGSFDGTYRSETPPVVRILAPVGVMIALAPVLCWMVPASQTIESPWTSTSGRVGVGRVVACIVLPVLVWWFFNALDDRFAPEHRSDAPAGGDPNRSLGG